MQRLGQADSVITDLFFQRDLVNEDLSLGYSALERIREGIAKRYVDNIVEKLKAKNIGCDYTIRKCLSIMGLHRSLSYGNPQSGKDYLGDSVIGYLECFGKEAPAKIEKILDEMYIKKAVESGMDALFKPLIDYMKQSPENQPLGYIVAEEAEKLGKPFVLVTSLRHAEGALIPILRSAKSRGWNMLEGANGSKEDRAYWKEAYRQLKGGEEHGKNS